MTSSPMPVSSHPEPASGGSPAEGRGRPVDGVEVLGALSPSRAGDFLTCPLLYRFRTIDRLPEPSSPDATRGTLVHKVLEDLFDLPAAQRTPEQAHALLSPTWAALLEAEPELAEMFGGEGPDVAAWMRTCRQVLDRYFTLEDPRRLEPAERELYVEALLDSKLREHRLKETVHHTVKEGDTLQFGPFELEFVAVNHSIPDALAVVIRTGAGTVLHTGDFKMDQLPLDGRITDLRSFARLGEEGVDLFLVDSTNAEVPGFTTAEKDISPVLDRVFAKSEQRIIVACFASHVHRVQQVLDAAVAHGRKVGWVGRSMVRNMGIAQDLGYLDVPPGVVVDAKELAELPPEKQVLISTGSQGEPLSALARIAQRNHNFVRIEEGDTVVLASSLIPGNENAVYRVINGLSRWGANVVHKGNALVHVSGHASAGELLYCYNIVQPRNVLPVHGEIRHMRANAELARATGVPNVVEAEDGVVVDLVDGKASIVGAVPCGYVYVDGSLVGTTDETMLKDRRILRDEGFVTIIVVRDAATGKIAAGPDIRTRGFAEDEQVFESLWRTLGLSVDWSQHYTTIGKRAQEASQRAFLRNFARGEAYLQEAPTLWDVTFQTAVAQAELKAQEYDGHYHRVHFHRPDGETVDIETTRPELIPSVVALIAHPDDERYAGLFGTTVTSPVFGVEIPVLAHAAAEPDKGSGLVMCCTFGDPPTSCGGVSCDCRPARSSPATGGSRRRRPSGSPAAPAPVCTPTSSPPRRCTPRARARCRRCASRATWSATPGRPSARRTSSRRATSRSRSSPAASGTSRTAAATSSCASSSSRAVTTSTSTPRSCAAATPTGSPA